LYSIKESVNVKMTLVIICLKRIADGLLLIQNLPKRKPAAPNP